MKILKFAILISFLFNSVAYPCENASNTLRIPLMSIDKTNQERLKFSLQHYRPGWTFEGWWAAKETIKQRFTSTKERKEALQLVRTLAKKLTENQISPGITLQIVIPAVARLAKTPQELKDICDTLFNLNIKLVENKLDPNRTFWLATAAVVKLEESPQSLKDVCDALFALSIKLAKTPQELKPAVPEAMFVRLSGIFAKVKIESSITPDARKFVTDQHISKAAELLRKQGDFRVTCKQVLQSYDIEILPPETTSTKLASGHNITGEFSLQDYRPGWTFAGWGETKEAIKQRFKSTEKRKEALQLVRTLAKKLAENKISPTDTLKYGILAAAKLARDMDEFKLFVNLGIKLAENKIDPDETLQYAIPAAAKVAKTMQERTDICYALFNLNIALDKNDMPPGSTLEDAIPAVAKLARDTDELEFFINLGIKLAEKEIHPGNTLQYAIPAVAKVTKTPQELKNMCYALLTLNIKLAKNQINPANTLRYAIQAVAKAARDADELRFLINFGIKLAENKIDPLATLRHAIPIVAKTAENTKGLKLFVNLGIKLAENKIYPGNTLEYIIPAVAEVTKTPQELKDICDTLFNLNVLAKNKEINSAHLDNLIDKSLEATGNSFKDLQEVCKDIIPKMASKMKEARVLNFITAEHIKRAVELQREYGDFKITYNHKYDPGEIDDDIIGRPPSESYEIQVLQPDSKGTKLASGQNVKGEFSLPDHKPWQTFEEWTEVKAVIEKKFTTIEEREKVLKIIKTFAKELVKNKTDPFYTLRDAIPSMVPILRNPEDMQAICDMLFNFNMQLTENGLEPYGTLAQAIPSAARAAKNMDELELFINLGIKLAENKIDPIGTLYSAIPAVAKVTKTPQELKDICDVLFNLNIKLAENKINPANTLNYAIPAAAKVAKDQQELKDMSDSLFNLNIKLTENNIDSVSILRDDISMLAELAKNKDEFELFINLGIKLAENGGIASGSLKNIIKQSFAAARNNFYDLQEICNNVIPKMASNVKEARVLDFITAEHIRRAVELQRGYGDFKITYNNEYDPGDTKGSIIVRPSSDSYKIQILPPDSKATKLASGQNVKGEFRLQDYRPGWTFKGWREAKEAIEQRFTSTKERKEVLQFVRTIARKLTENKIESYCTLRYSVPAAAKVAKTPQELKDMCDALLNLNIKFAENNVYSYYTLQYIIPAAAKAARNADELEIFINLTIKYAENKIYLSDTLEDIIPAIAKTTKTDQELKDICDTLFNLSVIAKNKGIDSRSFYSLIVQSLEAIGNSFEDFKEVCNDVIPNMASEMKKVRALNFITAEHIRRAVELQREYGDFKITYNYKYDPGNIIGMGSINRRFDGDMIDRPSSESCQIQVLPPDSIATKLAYGYAFVGLGQSL